MKIGDKVRFLSQTGGGIVVGFDKKGWALVEDSDGFEIPMPTKECVLIEENVVAKQDDSKKLSVKGGDKLHITMEFSKEDAMLNNESNYNLLVTYVVYYKDKCNLAFAGEILPFERKTIFAIDKQALQDGTKTIGLKILPFKRGAGKEVAIMQGRFNSYKGVDEAQSWEEKPVIEKDFTLNMLNLSQGKEVKIDVINENASPISLSSSFEKLKKDLESKYKEDIHLLKSKAAPKSVYVNNEDALIKTNSQGIMEVDLHINSLIESTIGMNNGDILLYQLEKFNEVMKQMQSQKGKKVVFIHGKGDGVLRQALLKELKNKYPKSSCQDASFKEYGFGATMITI